MRPICTEPVTAPFTSTRSATIRRGARPLSGATVGGALSNQRRRPCRVTRQERGVVPSVRGGETQHAEERQRAEVGMKDARASAVRREHGLHARSGVCPQELLQDGSLLRRSGGTHLARCRDAFAEVVRAKDFRQYKRA